MFTLPIIGPILEMVTNTVVGIFGKMKDAEVEKYKVDGATKASNNVTDVSVIQARSNVVIAFANDPGVKLSRDLIMFTTAMWFACIAYVSTFKNLIPEWTWTVELLPSSVEYMPYAVVSFIFASSWKK